MRHCRFDDNDKLIVDRPIESLKDLGNTMVKADWNDWISGLGQPSSYYDLDVWRTVGKFILEKASEPIV